MSKRTSTSSQLPARRTSGRHKRGVIKPVAQLAEATRKRRKVQVRPEVDVMADFIILVGKELQMELV